MTQYKMSSMKEERMQMQNAESVVLWPTDGNIDGWWRRRWMLWLNLAMARSQEANVINSVNLWFKN